MVLSNTIEICETSPVFDWLLIKHIGVHKSNLYNPTELLSSTYVEHSNTITNIHLKMSVQR